MSNVIGDALGIPKERADELIEQINRVGGSLEATVSFKELVTEIRRITNNDEEFFFLAFGFGTKV